MAERCDILVFGSGSMSQEGNPQAGSCPRLALGASGARVDTPKGQVVAASVVAHAEFGDFIVAGGG